MMRTEEAVSASIWLANVGRLTRTANMNSATAMERIVRRVLRMVRSRFLNIRRVNLAMAPPRLLRGLQRCGRHTARRRAYEYNLLETINGVDESLRAGDVPEHDQRPETLAIGLGS